MSPITDHFTPLHFYDQIIEPIFDVPPALEKSPPARTDSSGRGAPTA